MPPRIDRYAYAAVFSPYTQMSLSCLLALAILIFSLRHLLFLRCFSRATLLARYFTRDMPYEYYDGDAMLR